MTPSLERATEILPFEIPEKGDASLKKAVDLFSRLGIDNTFRAYSNVIDALNLWLLGGVASRFYSRLTKYKEVKALIGELRAYQGIPAAVPEPGKNNPVPNFTERPLATLILEPHKRGAEAYEEQNAFEVIKSLLVLVVLSGDRGKGVTNDRRIKKISEKLHRQYRKGHHIDELKILQDNLKKLSGYHGLVAFLRKNKEMQLFSWLVELLPYIEGSELKLIENDSYRISGNSGVAKIGVMSAQKVSIFSVPHSEINEDGDNDGLFAVTDISEAVPDITDLRPPTADLTEIENQVLDELFGDIEQVRNELSYLISSSTLRVLDRDFLMYDTAVFNPIERKWLVESLHDELPLRALITVLCISMGESASKIGEKHIGSSGDITLKGYFKREIPVLKNSKIPLDVNSDLYEEHISDCSSNVIYLPLPDVAKDLLKNIDGIKEDITVNELCNSHGYKATELVKAHMKGLREKYGSRFNSNRIPGQIKNYLNGSRRDACLTFALFGSETSQAPTSYYYRAFLTGDLIKAYGDICREYFCVDGK